ncbi:hypothetical protein C8A00DRAFT_38440 [Chaetomidium leptoderma]|uniref:Uncharacterized protein n=1 Tax=Chaetomidium leptoderma TaxID=669021 RepID=A0AAN6ZT05_9PEZI|nr:hypothetical protein C8A00DRAFT_38440 [Chaetomidium leptoderma]
MSAVAPPNRPKADFNGLPPEMQQQIFSDAIRQLVHTIRVDCDEKPNTNTWTLVFTPVSKQLDKSGYRLVKNIALTNKSGATAVRIAMKTRCKARLPFKGPKHRIDGAGDLVHVDFHRHSTATNRIDYFHPDHQLLNAHGKTFDSTDVTAKFTDIEKVALKYNKQQHACNNYLGNFRCVMPATRPHNAHRKWRMCPDEVFGFLNCFSQLREFYIILDPGRTIRQKELVDIYAKNYNILPSSSSLRQSLAVFHAMDHAYVELHPSLLRRLSLDGGSFDAFEFEILPEIRAMLDDLQTRCFHEDENEARSLAEQTRFEAMYRLTRQEREDLVFKVLIEVADEKKTMKWEGQDATAIKGFLGI